MLFCLGRHIKTSIVDFFIRCRYKWNVLKEDCGVYTRKKRRDKSMIRITTSHRPKTCDKNENAWRALGSHTRGGEQRRWGNTTRKRNRSFRFLLLDPDGGDRPGNIPESVAYFDPLTGLDRKLKVLGRFEHEDDGTAEAETAHFLCGRQRLPVEQRGCGGVDGFGVCPRWRWMATDVCAQGLFCGGRSTRCVSFGEDAIRSVCLRSQSSL